MLANDGGKACIQSGREPLRKLLRQISLAGSLDFSAWYADDGCAASDVYTLKALFDGLVTQGPPLGLHIYASKCEVITHDGNPLPEIPQVTKAFNMRAWCLLGSSCGDGEHRAAHSAVVAAKIARKVQVFAAVDDLQAAFVLLRLCGAFPSAVFHARAAGEQVAWEAVDAALSEVVAGAFALDAQAIFQASLPIRLGGLGLRFVAYHAAAACWAAASAARRLAHFLSPLVLPPDPLLLSSLNSLTLASFPAAHVRAVAMEQGDSVGAGAQGRIGSLIETARAETLLSGMSTADQTRLHAAAKGTNLWLSCPPDVMHLVGLTSSQFFSLVAFRLGLPIRESSGLCPLCCRVCSDIYGVHALRCMSGGLRTLAHNDLRDAVAGLASSALLNPLREQHPFPQSPSSRIDVVLPRGFGEKTALLDVAITSGDPTAYEGIKRAEYGRFVAASQLLIPLVCDVHGCWGSAAKSALSVVVRAFASRCADVRAGRLFFFATLNGVVMRWVARLLLAGEAGAGGF